MSCIIDNGYTLGCSSIGGVEQVWIGTWSGNASYTTDADNVITGVTSGVTVYSFEQDIEFAGLEQTVVPNRENGTVHIESVLSVKMIELTKDLRNTFNALMRAPLFAVVKSNAGQYYVAGVETAGRLTEGTASLGVAFEDMNGATASVTWKSKDGIYLINPALIGSAIPVA